MIKDWININDLNDMAQIGKFTYVRKLIREDLKEFQINECESEIDIGSVLHITSNSASGLIEKIKILRAVILKNYLQEINIRKDDVINVSLINKGENYLFVSEAHQLIFYLVNLDGEERMEKLKIYKAYYYNKEFAREWYSNILNKIHPDKLNGVMIKNTEKAIENLKEIYGGMKRGCN